MPTVPVTAMKFPLRTARLYPITGSHFDPELAQRRPARSVTVIWTSLLAIARVSSTGTPRRRDHMEPQSGVERRPNARFRWTPASRLLPASRPVKVAEAERDLEPPGETAQRVVEALPDGLRCRQHVVVGARR